MPQTTHYPTDLSDAAWTLLAPLLPPPLPRGRPRTTELRAILNAIFYLLRTGCPWRLLPREFPAWGTVYHYFRTWKNTGVWTGIQQKVYEQVRREAVNYQMPWHLNGAGSVLPVNASTHRPYRGVNVMMLWAVAANKEYATSLWATYQQWRDLGAQVRKGEKSTSVVFWKFFEDDTPEASEGNEPGNRVSWRAPRASRSTRRMSCSSGLSLRCSVEAPIQRLQRFVRPFLVKLQAGRISQCDQYGTVRQQKGTVDENDPQCHGLGAPTRGLRHRCGP